MRLGEYQNRWLKCDSCCDFHREDDRIWIKQFGLEMSSCPACGSVAIAPECQIKRQQDFIFEEAA